MTPVYRVNHYYQNPQLNRRVTCESLAEARRELRIMVRGDGGGGVSILFRNDVQIQRRRW